MFLECAAAAQAGYSVNGNIKDFPVMWGETRILSTLSGYHLGCNRGGTVVNKSGLAWRIPHRMSAA